MNATEKSVAINISQSTRDEMAAAVEGLPMNNAKRIVMAIILKFDGAGNDSSNSDT